jgi:ABC-type dipeptide/oligopeptide/nickel transport system permease subunit
MTELATTIKPPAEHHIGRSLWADARLRLWHDKVAMVCFAVIIIYAAIAILAPFVLSDWDQSFNYDKSNAKPSGEFWLGTDIFGRSVLQETLLAAHLSMTVAFLANVIAIPLGMILGALAGFYGKKFDDIVVWFYTTLACIPGLVRLIAIKFAFNGKVLFDGMWCEMDLDGMLGLVIALSVTSWIGTARLVRAETMRLRELDYVMASRACGRSGIAIVFRHILPNVMHLGIIQFSLGFVGVITAEVILSYLGLGVPNAPSWGKMISAANMDLVVGRWWELTAAVGAMFLIVLAWNIFGDRLRDALDPKLKKA